MHSALISAPSSGYIIDRTMKKSTFTGIRYENFRIQKLQETSPVLIYGPQETHPPVNSRHFSVTVFHNNRNLFHIIGSHLSPIRGDTPLVRNLYRNQAVSCHKAAILHKNHSIQADI